MRAKIDILTDNFNEALDEWAASATYTGTPNPEGLRLYAAMVEAGEALEAERDRLGIRCW
jgi:hypothetical protein